MKEKNVLFNLLLWVGIACIFFMGMKGFWPGEIQGRIEPEIDPAQPMLALTFDDGPKSQYTSQMLDVLYENQAPATFFVNGKNIHHHKDLLKKIVEEGHELGNHTFDHLDLTKLSPKEIALQVQKTQAEVEAVLPGYPLHYVRPPYGRYNEEVIETIAEPVLLWTIDSGDWEDPDADEIYRHVIKYMEDGAVVVFHDDNQETIEALRHLIPDLRERGYQFVTVGQLSRYRSLQPLLW